MKKFLNNLLWFVLILSFCCVSIVLFHVYVIGGQYQNNYQASIIDKISRLESIDEPKIILVGHSNLAFGINSEIIEDAMGMPVVNLGLHGSLGNAFHEQIAKRNINEKDIVVVCHSSFSDADNIPDRSLAWITIDNHIKLLNLLRPKDYLPMLQAYPTYFKDTFKYWITNTGNWCEPTSYARSAFNEYGDVVYKPVEYQMDVREYFSDNIIYVPEITDTCIQRLNEYNAFILSKGATLLVAGYPIAYGKYASFSESDFISFKEHLQQALECEVISDYTDYFYPYEYFYNTSLHLTQEGTDIRTRQLITDLQNWMGCQ